MDFWFVIAIALGSFIGGSLIAKALKKSKEKQADYNAIAQQFGWSYVHDTTSNRYGIYETFSDPDDDWTLKIIFISGGANDGSSTRRIEWRSPQGTLAEGEAALGMPLPEKTARMLQGGGAIASSLTKAALKATMYAMGRTKFSLALDEATAGDSGGMVLSTPGQERAMDSLRQNACLRAFRETHKEIDVPVIIRDDEGMLLRRPNVTSDAAELKALVDLGKALRAGL